MNTLKLNVFTISIKTYSLLLAPHSLVAIFLVVVFIVMQVSLLLRSLRELVLVMFLELIVITEKAVLTYYTSYALVNPFLDQIN